MAAVRWTEPARDDLAKIFDFIARDSPAAAQAFVERVLQSAERLAAFPESGRRVPEFPELRYRELIVSSYRVQYRIEADVAFILTVVHGRRLLTRSPSE